MHGLPTSWNPSIASKKSPSKIQTVIWSPCSRLVAISCEDSWTTVIEVLDATTFKQHICFRSSDRLQCLTFSPGTHLLTCVGIDAVDLISWDLQTGVSVSTISLEVKKGTVRSLAYSPCETMVGVLSLSTGTATICTYNILSGTHIYSHQIQGQDLYGIWTDGENLQFSTFGLGTITIWEVGFISEHSAVKVKSLPLPDDFNPSMEYTFLPTLSLFVYCPKDVVSVWDAQHSKFLLSFNAKVYWKIDASSNGKLFACGANGQEISLWKESPTGYILHQNIIGPKSLNQHLSPDGESIIVSHNSTLQLFYVTEAFVEISQSAGSFIVEFSPDGSLAAVAQLGGREAVVLGLGSGAQWLAINTDMGIHCLKIARNSIIAAGKNRIVTWNLPEMNHILNPRVDIHDSVQITEFDYTPHFGLVPFTSAVSISPDLSYIATAGVSLKIYEISTGKCLGGVGSTGDRLWFTPDGQEVWCHTNDGVKGWAVAKSDLLGQMELQPTEHQPEVCPWKSSYGYKVTHDGWVLSPSGKQLLCLPPHWQSNEIHRQWSGQFLALLHPDLPEIVILEFPEE